MLEHILFLVKTEKEDEGVEQMDNASQESDDMIDSMRLPTASDYYIVYSTQQGKRA